MKYYFLLPQFSVNLHFLFFRQSSTKYMRLLDYNLKKLKSTSKWNSFFPDHIRKPIGLPIVRALCTSEDRVDLTYLLWALFGPDNLPDGDIYGFGGCEDLSTRIWFSRYALPSNFSMIFRRVSIYFVEDCLRKCKMHIFRKTGVKENNYYYFYWENHIF